jgi:hypothetical protein
MERNELNTERTELLKSIHELPQTPGEAIITVDDNGIHTSLSASNEKRVQLRPTLFRTRHTRIHVFTFDLPTSTLAVLPQFSCLHRNILAVVCRADSRIDCDSHLLVPPVFESVRVFFLDPL